MRTKQRPALSVKELKFHQGNARPHVAQSVITFLQVHNSEPFAVLARSCSFRFQAIRQHQDSAARSYKRVKFDERNNRISQAIPKEELKKTFEMWIERKKLCIQFEGDDYSQF